jgi:nitroreductase
MDLDKAIKERHSVRNYKKGEKINYREIIDIVDAGTRAPLAGNMPCLNFILVSDEKKIKELAEASQQDFIADVPWIIVVCSNMSGISGMYYDRAERYARQQAGAAIENMLLKITDLKFASCWIGAFSDITVKRILEIPENIYVEAMIPVGLEMGKKKSQARRPEPDSLFFFNKWKNKYLDEKKHMTPGTKT